MNRLLIAGFGDIARRALPLLRPRFAIVALVRPERCAEANTHPGMRVEPGDLDEAATLERFGGWASHVLHLAPPPRRGTQDPRTEHLLAALAAHPPLPERLVYVSTSGVYGNCDGAWVEETRPVNPQSDRARRRVAAERAIVAFGRTHGVRTVILRAPGIYAAGRLPLQRLRNRTPVLRAEDDVYTNHVHGDDLAAMVVAALTHAAADGIYNACDDCALPMGVWFDLVADRNGLPRAPRIARAEAADVIAPPLLSFMSESRRLSNARIKRELGLALRYPSVDEGVAAAAAGSNASGEPG
ncbi:MAG: NAD-dependent epimerase/dehydratase family protein [Burkholderiales bacterium]|nr:NAD-dependent epimerase/dehydratase family protein [Burkholderiales bacterium]